MVRNERDRSGMVVVMEGEKREKEGKKKTQNKIKKTKLHFGSLNYLGSIALVP